MALFRCLTGYGFFYPHKATPMILHIKVAFSPFFSRKSQLSCISVSRELNAKESICFAEEKGLKKKGPMTSSEEKY